MRNLALKAYTWAEAHKHNEEGQTAIEYAVVVAAISLALVAALLLFGQSVITKAQAKVDAFVF